MEGESEENSLTLTIHSVLLRKELNRQLKAIYGDQIEITFESKFEPEGSDQEMESGLNSFVVNKIKDICENKLKVDELEYQKFDANQIEKDLE